MSNARMHDDEVETDDNLVRGLLASQHPQWADLPVERVLSAGTDNAIYRLGDDLAARLPRTSATADFMAREIKWLPVVAPRVPLPVPLPVAVGQPDDLFPFPWAVVRWLPGELATPDRHGDSVQVALDLAAFVRALRSISSTGGPHDSRGLPARRGDGMVRTGIDGLRGEVDGAAVADAWNRALTVPDHDGPPVWFHGDLSPLNLLMQDGTLSAVIDWGRCGVGDPAIDTVIAWSLFSSDARLAYRDALGIDDPAWERGKAWVLTGVFGIAYYRDTNPVLVGNIVRAIEAVLTDSP